MTHIGENISIVTFNGQLICVPEKLSGCYKESEHVENDEFITNDVSELLSYISCELSGIKSNSEKISRLIENVKSIQKMNINVQQSVESLSLQLHINITAANNLRKQRENFINELYDILYNSMMIASKYCVSTLNNNYDDTDLIELFNGTTNDDNIPSVGHYKKSSHLLSKKYNYTLENCFNLIFLLKQTFSKILNKKIDIDIILKNAEADIKMGYSLGPIFDSLNLLKSEIDNKLDCLKTSIKTTVDEITNTYFENAKKIVDGNIIKLDSPNLLI